MDTKIEEVERQIRKVERQIRKVEQQIDDVEGQLTKAATEADVAYWRKEKEQLRKKKEQLRKKEEQLRKEKEQLREKELLLLKTSTSGVGHQRRGEVVLTGNRSEGISFRLSSGVCSMREDTVRGLCRLILEKGAVLLRAPPQTGKTSLLDLITRSESVQDFKHVFYINLVQLSEVRTFDELWDIYVGKGISFFDFQKAPESSPEGKHKQQASPANTPPYLLLVDEGHAGFKHDIELWPLLKSVQSGRRKHLRMLIVSAWGSHNGPQESANSVATPGNWGSDSVVGLWPTDETPFALQLPVEEARELWGSWSMGAGLGDSIRDGIFDLTDRQPGLLTHVIDWLGKIGLSNIPVGKREEKIRESLLSSQFCDSLSSIRSIMRLSTGIAMGEYVKPLREFLRVLLREFAVSYGALSKEQKDGAIVALKWGQVTEVDGGSDKIMKLPSKLHEIYFMKQLYQNKKKGVRYDGLEAFVKQVVERMNPGQLQRSLSRTVSDKRLYERQYQAEFYRAALTVLPTGSWLSPDAGKLLGAEGYIDFYLSEPYSWGFELLRDGDRLQAHIDRFTEGGKYHGLIRNGYLKDYVILDFRMEHSPEHRLDGDEHFIRVVFREDFKTADLSGSGISNGSCSILVRGDGGLRT